jgi:hypothetical protein
MSHDSLYAAGPTSAGSEFSRLQFDANQAVAQCRGGTAPHFLRQGGNAMTRAHKTMDNDIQALEALHEELHRQAHQFKEEARRRWDELELKWESLKMQMQRAQIAADRSKVDVNNAIKQLADSLKSGYADIKKAMKS